MKIYINLNFPNIHMFDYSFIVNCRTINNLNHMTYEIHFYDNKIIFISKCVVPLRKINSSKATLVQILSNYQILRFCMNKCILSVKKLKPYLRKCLHLDSNKF